MPEVWPRQSTDAESVPAPAGRLPHLSPEAMFALLTEARAKAAAEVARLLLETGSTPADVMRIMLETAPEPLTPPDLVKDDPLPPPAAALVNLIHAARARVEISARTEVADREDPADSDDSRRHPEPTADEESP
jgi:hypothetical protein